MSRRSYFLDEDYSKVNKLEIDVENWMKQAHDYEDKTCQALKKIKALEAENATLKQSYQRVLHELAESSRWCAKHQEHIAALEAQAAIDAPVVAAAEAYVTASNAKRQLQDKVPVEITARTIKEHDAIYQFTYAETNANNALCKAVCARRDAMAEEER